MAVYSENVKIFKKSLEKKLEKYYSIIYERVMYVRDLKIGFIGPGKMAKAIVDGIISASFLAPENIYIYGRSLEKVAYFAEKGCKPCLDLACLSEDCRIIFLCIKPQNFLEITEKLKPLVSNKILYVSIAAGLSSDCIQKMLGQEVKLVRAMPNTPLLVGRGATAISSTPNVSEEELSTICNVFSSCGTVDIVDESLINPVIAVSGSSPAYIYLMEKHVREFAQAKGMDAITAKRMFCQTLIGSAHMLLESELTEDELISMVASKGGTTMAALDVLNGKGFKELMTDAMEACVNRALELGRQS